jgi:hypothetical protein
LRASIAESEDVRSRFSRYFKASAIAAAAVMSLSSAPRKPYYLMHANVRVKTVAAQMLGLYGSKSAAGPLWDAFRYLHDYGKDRRAEPPRMERVCN